VVAVLLSLLSFNHFADLCSIHTAGRCRWNSRLWDIAARIITKRGLSQ